MACWVKICRAVRNRWLQLPQGQEPGGVIIAERRGFVDGMITIKVHRASDQQEFPVVLHRHASGQELQAAIQSIVLAQPADQFVFHAGRKLDCKWTLKDQGIGHGDDVYVHVSRSLHRRTIETYAYSKHDGARPDEDYAKLSLQDDDACAAATDSNVITEFTACSVRVEVHTEEVDYVFCRPVIFFGKGEISSVVNVPFMIDPAKCSVKVVPGKKITVILKPTIDGEGPQRPRLEQMPEFGIDSAGNNPAKDDITGVHEEKGASNAELHRYLCGPDTTYDYKCFRCNAPLKQKKGEIIGEARRCVGCKQAYYCDRVCQRIHWQNGHREECPKLAVNIPHLPPEPPPKVAPGSQCAQQ